MINQYPWWKNLIIAVILAVGVVYALPNLYGEDPALQIMPVRGAKLDQAVEGRIKGLLDQAGFKYLSPEHEGSGLLIRFNDTETQLKAQDIIKQGMGAGYVVALNLAPSTPVWLRAIGAKPMYLGLDLRGGVHFLMEVDMDTVVKQAYERYSGDFRILLRNNKLHYTAVGPHEGGGVEVKFREAAERDQAQKLVGKEYPDLILSDVDGGGEYTLLANLSPRELTETRRLAIHQNITTLRNRVNELGVAEPIVQQQGENRIVVQLPGVQDTARAKEILGATATLEFRLVDDAHDVQDALAGHVPAGSSLYHERNGNPVLLQKRVIITGESITDAASGIDQTDGSPAVFITLDGKGARSMSSITQENVGKLMAVVFIETKSETKMVDGQMTRVKETVQEVISIARIREALSKRFQITGLDSTQEARNLALLLRAGALSAPVDIIEERTVGPSLGAENIKRGFDSTIIGFAAIALFMTFYYRLFGLIASISLFGNMVLLVAVLSMMQATLTLPGIAGIALTVGMAIDANVLIFERVREELRNGNTPQSSIHAGYDRAWDTIFDSNITTLIAGLALFLLGSGPVRGFAVVLCIGILTSMFSAVLVSRAMVNLLYGRRKVSRLAI